MKINWLYILIGFVIFRFLKMESLKEKFLNHVLRWEGKLGGSKYDTGAINNGGYAPGTKYHTSRGVTWGTYKNYCKDLGISPNVNKWLEMSLQLWSDIIEKRFFEKWNLKQLFLIYPKLAYFVIEIAWMSGNFGAEAFFAKYLRAKGIEDNDIKPAEIEGYLIKLITDGNFNFDELINYRKEYMKSFKNYSIYKNGWNNRLESFRTL